MKKLLAPLLLIACLRAGAQDAFPKNRDIDVLHYAFNLVLSDSTDTIRGAAAVTVLFKKETRDFQLDLADGMAVSSIAENGQQVPFTHIANKLAIKTNAQTGTEHVFVISYQGVPVKGLIIKKNKYNDHCFFSDNWPDRTRQWLPVIDQPYDKATCEFIVTAPGHYKVISNGALLEESALAGGMKRTHWKEGVPIPSWLFALGAADFAIEHREPWHGLPIETWVYYQDRDKGFYDFAEPTRAALDFYDAYIGTYSYEKLANVEANSVGGATELASCIFYGDRSVSCTRAHYWQITIAHEIAHHWFGNAVTEDDWNDVWLSEGFATYFSFLFTNHAYGREAFVDELLASRKKVFDFYAIHKNYRIVHDRLADMQQVTTVQTYQKGAWVLHMLRDKIGDSAFQQGIRGYYNRYRNANATTTDFRHAMEQASGVSLDSFFTQWLYRGGNPRLQCGWRYDAAEKLLHVNIKQVQDDGYVFQLPVEIGVYVAGQVQPVIKKYMLNSLSQNFTIPLELAPEKIVADPRTVLLADISCVRVNKQ